MLIEAVELRQVEIPMVEPMAAAHGSTSSRQLVLVRAITDAGEGWGECVAMNEPTYTADWSTGEYAVIRDVLLPALFRRGEDVDAESAFDCLSRFTDHHPAKAAIEMALLDVELRAAGHSLARYLGSSATSVEASVVVGLWDGDALLRTVERKLEQGFRHFKLKIAPGRDVQRIDTVLKRFPDVTWRVDANGSYRWDNSDHRAALAEIDSRHPAAIEQPLPPDHPTWYLDLHARLQSPVALDESITSIERARAATEANLCDIITVKPGMIGGYLTAKRLHDECRNHEVRLVVGGMVDGALSRAANLAVAAMPGFDGSPAEVAPDGRWFAERLNVEPVEMHDGRLAVPAGPGIGVELDAGVLQRLTRRTHVARRNE